MVTAAKDRLTGPGKIQKLPDGSSLLFNYDIDGAALKPEHAAFLDKTVVAAANASPRGLRVVIGGSADRLGGSAHNVELSNRRIANVVAFLKRRKPGFAWDIQGFGSGVGEDNATRAGDKDETPDELFRSVIIDVLAPGDPIPPKPSIPRVFPKKPNVVPRALPRTNPSTCLTEQECPLSQSFTIQLLVGVTGGEILEAGFFVFLVTDVTQRLSSLYSLSAGGLGTPGLPANVSAVGKPTPFLTSKPTRVTNFGPVGTITSLTSPSLFIGLAPITIFSFLSFSFHASGSSVPSGVVFIGKFDTGPISIPGAGIHAGRFEAHGRCRGSLGADRA